MFLNYGYITIRKSFTQPPTVLYAGDFSVVHLERTPLIIMLAVVERAYLPECIMYHITSTFRASVLRSIMYDVCLATTVAGMHVILHNYSVPIVQNT